MISIREALKELSALHGVSSREEAVIRYMERGFSRFSPEVSVDVLGNVVCRFSCGRPDPRRAMVFGHTDEVGFMVSRVDPDGFLRIQRVGGVHQTVLAGLRLDVLGDKGTVPGVIGIRSHHVERPEEKRIVPEVERLYVDVGAESKADAEAMGVHTGCFASFAAQPVRELGPHRLAGKAMDDRAACAVLLALGSALSGLAERGALGWDIYLVACVQEEFNVRGILPAVERIRPHASVGLDICIAGDTPELLGAGEIRLGGGPAVTCMNFHGRGTLAGVLPDRRLQAALEETARREGIPFQREVINGLITENAFISFSGGGVPVANLSIPCRYSHTPIETVDERDLVLLARLLEAWAGSLGPDTRYGKESEKEAAP